MISEEQQTLVSSTAISTYVTDSGGNSTNNAGGLITVNTTGNVKSGSYDDDSTWNNKSMM